VALVQNPVKSRKNQKNLWGTRHARIVKTSHGALHNTMDIHSLPHVNNAEENKMARTKQMTELPDRCDHPEEHVSNIRFDMLDQPYRRCNKCGEEFCGRDALNHLHTMWSQQKIGDKI
jgi:hypothetical protein